MQFFTISVCKRCRQALSRQFHSSLPGPRSAKPQKAYRRAMDRENDHRMAMDRENDPFFTALPTFTPGYRSPTYAHKSLVSRRTLENTNRPHAVPAPTPEAVRQMLLRHLSSWKSANQTVERFTSLGMELGEVQALLDEYEPYIMEEIQSEHLTGEDPWSIAHVLDGFFVNESAITDRVLTMRLFPFAAQPGLHIEGVGEHSMRMLQQANMAFDLRYPPEVFHMARRLRRKVYLHVGPTNSGKTYHALRALATARSGIYAGPLRLLAHEVWERLNRGSIRPHGTDPAEAHNYARPCNLITGEEQRIVSPSAPLTSCTVEMINLFSKCEVCVIDEIQMIADPQRGNAWTTALLGVLAEEIHLCGEEAAVPLITELMRETGDILEIKRYQRLTPLAVADQSLQRRWDRVQKGDCVVTFSRKSIFSLKRIVEEATGLRCAVAYGSLPPETRSEQAALFNDPNSGYDVMVASDAIGMGLNLKIKRIIFVQLSKFDGTRDVPLSVSQIKQIGGRAGRFGEHGDSSSVGIVTCLNQCDLPFLARAFDTDAPMLQRAYLPLDLTVLTEVAQLLPPSFSLKALHSLISLAGRLGKNYNMPFTKVAGMDIIDHFGSDLKLFEKLQFCRAPTNWRPGADLDIITQYLRQFAQGKTVDISEILQNAGLLDTLQRVNVARLHHEEKLSEVMGAATGYDVQTSATLDTLETLHKALVTYSWMSFRIPISFSQRAETIKLKEETEKGIEFVLEGIAYLEETQRLQVKTLRGLRLETAHRRINYKLRGLKTGSRILKKFGELTSP